MYDSLGFEVKTLMERVSMTSPLAGVRFGLVLAQSVAAPIAFCGGRSAHKSALGAEMWSVVTLIKVVKFLRSMQSRAFVQRQCQAHSIKILTGQHNVKVAREITVPKRRFATICCFPGQLQV